ncbi:MAG: cyclic-di-AMP receptor [Anaerolineaceae bacterium]|nr:MAG: cyclic-di-AMP receptor [Anaerolineaceae bacterium]
MKLIILILDDEVAEEALRDLIEREFRVTRVASTGGFLRRGNTTLLIGTQDDLVDDALEVIRSIRRDPEREQHRTTVFVLDMERFEQL